MPVALYAILTPLYELLRRGAIPILPQAETPHRGAQRATGTAPEKPHGNRRRDGGSSPGGRVAPLLEIGGEHEAATGSKFENPQKAPFCDFLRIFVLFGFCP